ncbi:MAG: leucyl aminopeptidase [Chloroflexi bacterium]|nr:leucyl aminopeptidase [Chloroflexota bacterium]
MPQAGKDSMNIRVVLGDIAGQPADAAVINLFEGVTQPGGATGAVDHALGGAITQVIATGEAKGKKGEITLLHTFGKTTPARVVIAGLGKQSDFTYDSTRVLMAEVLRFLRARGAKRVSTIVHGAGIGGLDVTRCAQAIAEGALLGAYRFVRHKSKSDNNSDVEELLIVERDAARLPALEQGVRTGLLLAESANLARDLVNEPANIMTPTKLAESARRVAAECKLEITVLERPQLEDLKMGGILGVAKGSAQPPTFTILIYKGDPQHPKRILGLVGKGISFDSGGISLKPASGMARQKSDMAGAAAVLCATRAIALLKPHINVTALLPSAENMPSATAQKPGDVLTIFGGKTVEVDNTDAEGRLLLADAISYGKSTRGLSLIVDVATLTGAMTSFFGDVCAGIFGTDKQFLDRIVQAGEAAGEKFWPLPLFEEYRELNNSDVADLKNSAGSCGAVTAAWFLAEFAQGVPWAHLDIAGVRFVDRQRGYIVKGATGIPTRSLVHLALSLADDWSRQG